MDDRLALVTIWLYLQFHTLTFIPISKQANQELILGSTEISQYSRINSHYSAASLVSQYKKHMNIQ